MTTLAQDLGGVVRLLERDPLDPRNIDKAVQFLLANSAEIAGALRDAERYRWLKCNCQHMPDELGIAGQLYFGTYAWGDLDTAIDSAMQQGGGGGDHA